MAKAPAYTTGSQVSWVCFLGLMCPILCYLFCGKGRVLGFLLVLRSAPQCVESFVCGGEFFFLIKC